MKTYIKDELTNTFYAVECSNNPKGFITSSNEQGTPGNYDFPFWTDNINEAFDFRTEMLAQHEMNLIDTTEDGTRKPIIIKIN